MSAFLIIPILLLAIVAIVAIIQQRRLSSKTDEQHMVAPPKSGLFSVDKPAGARPLRLNKESEKPSDLFARAKTGDLDTLTEAHATGN
jgi:hypothetical protein